MEHWITSQLNGSLDFGSPKCLTPEYCFSFGSPNTEPTAMSQSPPAERYSYSYSGVHGPNDSVSQHRHSSLLPQQSLSRSSSFQSQIQMPPINSSSPQSLPSTTTLPSTFQSSPAQWKMFTTYSKDGLKRPATYRASNWRRKYPWLKVQISKHRTVQHS